MTIFLLQGQTAADVIALVLTGLTVVLFALGLLIWLVSISKLLCRTKSSKTEPIQTIQPPVVQLPSETHADDVITAVITAALTVAMEPKANPPKIISLQPASLAAVRPVWGEESIRQQLHPFLPHF